MPEPLDRELNLRGVIGFGLGLVVVMVAVAFLMWLLSGFFRSQAEANDPPPAVLPEARFQPRPPGPLLQTDPIEDLQKLRQEEQEILDGYAWVDQDTKIVWIPIDLALELVAQMGLPEATEADAEASEPVTETVEKELP
jgi:hypothetical protein